MGVSIKYMSSVYNKSDSYENSVTQLAFESLSAILNNGTSKNISALITATTCPDTLAPSLGHKIGEKFQALPVNCQIYDLVQGCAGGITALALGYNIARLNLTNVAVVLADSARQAVSKKNSLRTHLSNGAFSCIIQPDDSNKGLVHYKTMQFKNLVDIVNVKLGHQTNIEINKRPKAILADPLKELGLYMDNFQGLKMLMEAENFYEEFIRECKVNPDIIVFHQVNPRILRKLESIFDSKADEFVNLATDIGNCGVASFGVALDKIKDRVENKKIFLCSFGTGGIISAVLWQF
jgi:3-oxoacyl-[acyl-carrier-protein] synthase III